MIFYFVYNDLLLLLCLSSPFFSFFSSFSFLCPFLSPHLTLRMAVIALHTTCNKGNNVLYWLLWLGCGLLPKGSLVLNEGKWWSLQEGDPSENGHIIGSTALRRHLGSFVDPSSLPWGWPDIKEHHWALQFRGFPTLQRMTSNMRPQQQSNWKGHSILVFKLPKLWANLFSTYYLAPVISIETRLRHDLWAWCKST